MRPSLRAAAVVAIGLVLSACGSAAANPVTTVPVTKVPVTTVPVNAAPGVAISDDELAELEQDISDIDAIISQVSTEIAQG